jgi:hypothetical protein
VLDPDTKRKQLHAACERISANLIDLEIDVGRQLLDASTLEGESAARWTEASAALTELWREHGLLQELLRAADELRGARHTFELAALLGGPSITLTRDDVPIAERELLGSSEAEQRFTPDQLLARMSAAFDQVKAASSAIGQAWDVLLPKLDVARRAAAEATRLAEGLERSDAAGLGEANASLNELAAKVSADPLSTCAEEVEQVSARLTAIVAELERALELKQGFERRMLEARELLAALDSALAGCAASREELLRKISGAEAAPVPGPQPGLGPELEAIEELAEHEGWREAARALEAWTGRVNALSAAAAAAQAANRAPVESRNQLRALLDAYRVKAKRLGRLEDSRLAALFEQAQSVLYTAPSDLGEAARLVRAYQQALGAPPAVVDDAEVKR